MTLTYTYVYAYYIYTVCILTIHSQYTYTYTFSIYSQIHIRIHLAYIQHTFSIPSYKYTQKYSINISQNPIVVITGNCTTTLFLMKPKPSQKQDQPFISIQEARPRINTSIYYQREITLDLSMTQGREDRVKLTTLVPT